MIGIQVGRRLVWATAVVSVALVGAGIGFALVDLGDFQVDQFSFPGWDAVGGVLYVAVSLPILRRQPSNGIGLMLLAVGAFSSLYWFASQYGLATVVGSVDLPGGDYAAWLQAWGWLIMVIAVLGFIPALFPEGRLEGRLERALFGLGIAAIIFGVVGIGTKPGPLSDEASYAVNPLPIESLPHDVIEPMGILMLAAVALGGVVALVRTYRRGGEVERLQIKWLTLAYVYLGLTFASVMLLLVFVGEDWLDRSREVWETAILVGLLLIPLAIGIAVTRYRLYDVDVVINRAIVYGPLSAVVAASYVGSVQLARLAFVGVTGERSDSELLAATLVAATVFWMVRTRLIQVVDRHFKDPREPWKDLQALRASITQTAQIIEPSAVSAERLAQHVLGQCVSAFGASGGSLTLQAGLGGSERVVSGAPGITPALSVDVEHQGTALGTLELGQRESGRPYGMRDREALSETASTLAEILARKSMR